MKLIKLKAKLVLTGLVLVGYCLLSGCELINKSRCPDVNISYRGDRGDVYYPNISQQPKAVLPTLEPAPIGVFSLEQVDVGDDKQITFTDNIPDFNTNTGGFNVNNPDLVAGVRYTVKFQPSEQCYRKRSYTTSFLVQGLAYKSGIYGPNLTNLVPTYNGDGKTTLPANIVPGYSFVLTDARQAVLQRGDRGTPDAAVVERDVQLDLRRLRRFFGNQPPPSQPLRLTINYNFTDGNFNVAARAAVEVYYFRSRADIPAALLARVTALARFPQGRSEETYGERPPLIIIVDVG
jgi:hypothetical protein